MPRYFIEVAYKGTAYAGFQVQQNANTIQSELEKALGIFFRMEFQLTGSSRTDAGVHARQNFFHFDNDIPGDAASLNRAVYHINAILPADIVVNRLYQVAPEAHCRFDAVSRSYAYTIYTSKDPFLEDRAFYYPYDVALDKLKAAAAMIIGTHDFESFAKRNSQVHTFNCTILACDWNMEHDLLVFTITGNRFLRGMVRGLVGTMLKVGRGKATLNQFHDILLAKNATLADFSTPAHGLSLMAVSFP
ncbi:MAG: tRNA pseudouridine(38-40) synthase TruA [Sphingobacteriales bacterium]|nr:MAG: tRNA pseudouridine(38-40) synthase TruA [Sphingobacteriales bacterium]